MVGSSLSVLALFAVLARSLVSRFAFRACTLPSLSRFPFYDSQVYVGWFFGSKGAPRRPKSDSKLLFLAPRASKSAPRGLQETFRGLPRRRCDSDPILDQFLAPKTEPGTLKIIEILARVVKNQGFAILSLDRFRTSIWDPPGLLLEGIWPPGNAETSLLSGLGPSKSRFK